MTEERTTDPAPETPAPVPPTSAPTPEPLATPHVTKTRAASAAAPDGTGDYELVRMSWYVMGTRTASGERLDTSAPTCAAVKRIPMGARLELHNPENGRTTVVRVNDRGAFAKFGRTLDCVPGVWDALGFDRSRGVVGVEMRAAA